MGHESSGQEADAFDGYHRWLGIPKYEQPPHYYRLLGLSPFENDADVIENAATSRMTSLRRHQGGPHGRLCSQLLNEIARARLCLLKPEKKAEYDAQLEADMFPEVADDMEADDFDEIDSDDEIEMEVVAEAPFMAESYTRPRVAVLKRSSPIAVIVASILGGVAAMALLWYLGWLPVMQDGQDERRRKPKPSAVPNKPGNSTKSGTRKTADAVIRGAADSIDMKKRSMEGLEMSNAQKEYLNTQLLPKAGSATGVGHTSVEVPEIKFAPVK